MANDEDPVEKEGTEDTPLVGQTAQMKFETPQAILTEMQTIRPVGSVDAPFAQGEYQKLTDRNFELLLFALFNRDKAEPWNGIEYDDVHLLNVGADAGRDVVLLRSGQPVSVVQCKRHQSPFSLPEVFREVAKLLAFAHINRDLIPNADGFGYVLALSGNATGPAASLFHEPERVVRQQRDLIQVCVQQILSEYKTFEGLNAETLSKQVLEILPKLTLKLITRENLDLWLAHRPKVFSTFFATRMVIDVEVVTERLNSVDKKLTELIGQSSKTRSLLQVWLLHEDVANTLAVVAPSPIAGRADPIALSDVYVQRTIEAQVEKWLDSDGIETSEGTLIAIVAPGGSGKTSLLWNQHRSIKSKPDCEALFFSSAQISSLVEQQVFADSLGALISYTRGLVNEGTRLVICIDTFDVLVHHSSFFSAGIHLVKCLIAAGANVILSSRPEELASVKIDTLARKFVSLYLQPYDDDEFARAVASHCKAFYRHSNLSPEEVEEQINRLKNLVGLGRPVKEVCLNPLTLRMLFELYAPNQISEDINSFGLYTEYWIAKVRGDKRAGSNHSASQGRDLSSTVESLAALILTVGAPSLNKSQIAQLLAGGEVPEADISELLSRNLLVRSELGTIEFFHQTFFEYCAARSLAKSAPGDARKCVELLRAAANDGFRLPVYEQLMLLIAESPKTKVAEIESGIAELLNESHPGLLGVGLHVHMLSATGLECGRAFIHNAATRQDTAVLKRFCQLIYNLRSTRSQEVAHTINASWNTNNWAVVELISRLFEWLAQNQWSLCRSQLEAHDLIGKLYRTAQKSVHVEKIVVAILRHGFTTDSDWTVRKALQHPRNQRHHPTILSLLVANADRVSLATAKYAVQEISRLVHAAAGQHTGSDIEPPGNCLAAFFNAFPQLIAPYTASMESPGIEPDRLMLTALSCTHNPSFQDLKVRLIENASLSAVPSALYPILQGFIIPLLINTKNPAEPIASSISRLIEKFCIPMLASFRGTDATTTMPISQGVAMVFCGFLKEAYVQGVAVADVAKIGGQLSMDEWLKGGWTLSLFPCALAEQLPQALAAFKKTCSQPLDYPKHLAVVNGTLARLPPTRRQFSHMVSAAEATDAIFITSYLTRLEESKFWPEFKGDFIGHASRLEAIALNGMQSGKSTLRAASSGLLALLIRHAAISPLSTSRALELLTKEVNLGCRNALLPLVVLSTEADSFILTIHALVNLGTRTKSKDVNPVVDSLRQMLKRPAASLPRATVTTLLDFALRPDATEPQTSLVGRVIDACCEEGDISTANEAALALIRSENVRLFGATQKRTLAHHLDKPFLSLYKKLPLEALTSHTQSLRGMDQYLGRLIVTALCKSGRPDFEEVLNEIVSDGTIQPELKKVIQDYRQYLWKR